MTTPARTRRWRLPWSRVRDPSLEAASPEFGTVAAPSTEFAEAGRFSQTFRALRHRNFRLFYTGQAISLTGGWMQTIAQAWLVLELTDSKEALGIVTMLQFLPITLFVLLAGVLADRLPKRDVILWTRVLAMIQAFLLAALVASGTVELWHVYILALVLGVSNAFEQPTRQAFVAEMVGRDNLMNAVALNSGLFNGARLVGPAIGGVVIAAAGVETAFFINAISFLPVIWALLAMDQTQFEGGGRPPAAAAADTLGELREGIGYALRTPATRVVIILAFFIGMFGFNFIVAVPLVARFVLGGAASALGFLMAALGLGAVISALVLAGRSRIKLRTVFLGGAGFTILLAAVAVSEWFPVTMLVLLGLGIMLTTFAATANTWLQLATPDHLRGRVMGLWMLLFAGSTPFGGLLTGFLAEQIGVQEALGFNAGMCGLGLVLGLLYYVSNREAINATADASRLKTAGGIA